MRVHNIHSKVGTDLYYRIAGYIGGNNNIFGGLLEKGRKLQLADINLTVTV